MSASGMGGSYGEDTSQSSSRRPQIHALFHGGYSYSPPDASDPSHAETFSSVRAAKDELARRYSGRASEYPVVDESATMHLFYGTPPSERSDPYPDAQLNIGPRGGVRHERT